jgi:DNA polymerase-1
MPNYVPGMGNPHAKIMIVGEAPGEEENRLGLPFVGKSGEYLTNLLKLAGIKREECWITNVLKYQPPHNEWKRMAEVGIDLGQQVRNLWNEIEQINPNVIVPLGAHALQAVTGHSKISNYRGSILRTLKGQWKAVPTYHPAHMLRQKGGEIPDYKLNVVLRLDLERAREQSLFPDYKVPHRSLRVIRDSGSLYSFFRANKDKSLVSVDIETTKCIPLCIGLAFSRNEAVSIPLLDIISPKNPGGISELQLSSMWKLVASLLRTPGMRVIGHNYKFDEARLDSIGMPTRDLYCDTMLLAHTVNPELPKALEFVTSIYTEEPYYKNEREDYDPKKHDIKRLLLYNARDAAVTYEVYEELIKDLVEYGLEEFFFGYVMKLHKAYLDMEREGLLVNQDYRFMLDVKYSQLFFALQAEMENMVRHPVNCNSNSENGQVATLLYKELGIPKRAGVDADTIVALINNTIKSPLHKAVCENILEQRKVTKTLGTYVRARPDYDGRMRTSYRIVGTETGRSSTSVLKAPVRPEQVGLAFQTMTKHGEIGTEIRKMFIPDPGWILLEADGSQAEARAVSILAEDTETLELFKKTDIHKMTAAWCFETNYDHVTKEFRFIGKKVRHAGNYDMGKARCMQVVNTDAQKYGLDVSISEWKAGQLLDKFHQFAPKVRGVFHKAIQEALAANNRILITPFGRRRQFLARWGNDLFKEAYAYIPQSTISDQVKMAMLATRERLPGIRVILESHDAFMVMIKPNDLKEVATVMKEEMERPIDFSKCTIPRGTIVIPCELQTSDSNWKDLTEYRLEVAA